MENEAGRTTHLPTVKACPYCGSILIRPTERSQCYVCMVRHCESEGRPFMIVFILEIEEVHDAAA